jgi:hypothetical protein
MLGSGFTTLAARSARMLWSRVSAEMGTFRVLLLAGALGRIWRIALSMYMVESTS